MRYNPLIRDALRSSSLAAARRLGVIASVLQDASSSWSTYDGRGLVSGPLISLSRARTLEVVLLPGPTQL